VQSCAANRGIEIPPPPRASPGLAVSTLLLGQKKLACIHFRKVTGKVPFYRETFIDDGDIDMLRVLRIF
jgi:hypothetical protein